MSFPFTFNFAASRTTNPFAGTAQPKSAPAPVSASTSSHVRHFPANHMDKPGPRRRPSPLHSSSFEEPAPLRRKRGWEPSLAEPARAATSAALTGGYLDTPAKYRDMVSEASRSREDLEREIEDIAADLPPNKKRRTLAGSIASTALSAALIGTAVGLTVYRLWRDRGNNPNDPNVLPPPPAYEQGTWVPPHEQVPQTLVSPPTPTTAPATRSRKPRSTPVAKRVAASTRHRRTRTQGAAGTLSSPTRPEFDFSRVQQGPAAAAEEEDPDDEMDWIGGRLSALIAEGQKALGREIVVASEAAEDAMDDGADPEAWIEEYPDSGLSPSRRSHSRAGSIRRANRSAHAPMPIQTSFDARSRSGSGSASILGSPRISRFEQASMGVQIPSAGGSIRGLSNDSMRVPPSPSVGSSFREDESAWESPELRESMSRARARLLAARTRG
ncbi:hypothetical protein HWV62_13329 [Athelia sp. TMB]|nr:hypothetical protein HWV62_13329 [Athelia sp. TMB]